MMGHLEILLGREIAAASVDQKIKTVSLICQVKKNLFVNIWVTIPSELQIYEKCYSTLQSFTNFSISHLLLSIA